MRPLEGLFVVALVLYTGVIWTHRFKKHLTGWMVALFGVGLLADVSGTIALCAFSANGWTWTLHTISGLASLLIMGLHFVWALWEWAEVRSGSLFQRYSVYAWLLWLVAFISGIPLH